MNLDLNKNTKVSYFLISGVFNLGLAIFCWRKRPENISLKDWFLLVLATFRMSRMLAYDTVMQTYRSPVVETVPHDSGAGDTTQVRRDVTGFKKALGEMISCPICNGTWIAAGLVYGLCLVPNYARTLITVMSAVGASEVLHAGFEFVQWQGELARHRAGEQMRTNRQYNEQHQPSPSPAPKTNPSHVRAAWDTALRG